MKIKLATFWEKLNGSFWFLPGLMVLASIALALIMISIDQRQPGASIPALEWLYTASPDGARSLLSMIGGSMISVAGVTFSITIATLSFASAQLGPRLLNNFMRDRTTQSVLGIFVAMFTYCLLVLRVVRSSDDVTFVPHLAVTVAVLLALLSLGMLIYFFHHVSTMLQAPNVIAHIGQELEAAIERLFSKGAQRDHYEQELLSEDDIPEDIEENNTAIMTEASGYLQSVDYSALKQVAHEEDLLLKLLYRPGEFVAKGSEIVMIYPEQKVSDETQKTIHSALTVGTVRLRVQDIEFAIDQLVEIAVRALSPGVNDPFTAIACLDQFSTILSDLAERTIPSGYYYSDEDNLRVISKALTFGGLVNEAFNQIRRHGRGDVAVMIRLLEVIASIIVRTTTEDQRQALIRQAEMVKNTSADVIPEAQDREDIIAHYDLVMKMLAEKKS